MTQAAANPSPEFSNANDDRYQSVDAFAVVDGMSALGERAPSCDNA